MPRPSSSTAGYQHIVAEAFGYPSDATESRARSAWRRHECAFLGRKCVKLSQHRDYDATIPFGACSVWHKGTGSQEPSPYIICPIRFVQNSRIFLDASRLLVQQPSSKTVVIPEVSLPMGRIDYVISRYATTARRVVDFVVLEVMACSTTTTGDVLRSFHDILQGKTTSRRLKYGINFRQVISRMMVQVLAKAYACEKWHKRMVWAVQDVLYRYMAATTQLDLRRIPMADTPRLDEDTTILFHIYSMRRNPGAECFDLELAEVRGGNMRDFARVFEPKEIPETDGLLSLLTRKILDGDSAFTLDTPLSEGLARTAADIVRDSPD